MPKYRITWKTYFLPLIGLAAFFVYVYVFQGDLTKIADMVHHANLFFYLLAIIASLLDTLLFAVAWHSLLRFLSVKIPLLKSVLFVWIGIFVDTLIPAESLSGEICKIYLVTKEQEGTAGRATASIVAQRMIGMGMNIASLLVGTSFLLAAGQLHGLLLVLTSILVGLTLLFLVLVLLLCVKEKWTMKIVDGVIRLGERISKGRWKLSGLREEAIRATRAFHGAMKEYAHAPRTLFVASFFSISSWILTLAVFYLTFLAIGYPQISWGTILVVSSIFMAIKSIPTGVPFEVGFPEITLTFLLNLFGVPGEISTAATILMRLLTLWLRFFIGFGVQQWVGLKTITAGTENKDAPFNEKPKSSFPTDFG